MRMKTINIKNNLTNFFKLNLISLKLNQTYKLNKSLIILLILGILSSIIVRSNFINEELLNINNLSILILTKMLILFSILYSIKIIFDITGKIIQFFNIIHQFNIWYNENLRNIIPIITYFILQNIFIISLSSLIFYNINIKLNLFIEDIYLYIIFIGSLSSIFFYYYYPLNKFKIHNLKEQSLLNYFLFVIFIFLYVFILPLLIINVINNDTFMNIKEEYFKYAVKIVGPNYMDQPSSSIRIINNNKIDVPNANNLEISGNNIITVRDSNNQVNNYNVNNYDIRNIIRPLDNYLISESSNNTPNIENTTSQESIQNNTSNSSNES
jgi:hypothetical protein